MPVNLKVRMLTFDPCVQSTKRQLTPVFAVTSLHELFCGRKVFISAQGVLQHPNPRHDEDGTEMYIYGKQ